MKKPSLHVTKWLGDIPVEAECTSCAGIEKFKVRPASHRPSRDEYARQLQQAFDHHFKAVHGSEAIKKENQG